MEKGAIVHDHVFKMIGLIQCMEKLGHPYNDDLATYIILHSLPECFNQFIMNFNMTATAKTMNQLHAMLVSDEKQIPKEPKKEVLMIQKGKGFKKKGQKASAKSKGKQVSKAPEKPKTSPKPKAASESECFYCKKKGHWKRNYQKYHEFLKKNGASTSAAKTMNQLHAMLVSAEKQIPKEPKKEVLMIQKGKGFKKKGQKASAKRKGKQVAKAAEKPKMTPKPKDASESECFYCKKNGHWKRNFKKYHNFLKKNGASNSGIML
ncbi:uncharacterized protein LOC110713777 [Chenopodium quinoa]|uniref:uncharacterized protein LOC110713777 n=1 Tax=Chenopodium quinoa TaxID=63459 RepID=UPI000B794A8D|nr:uncharacterized protein LOC110713777 [Chenopodium quinoa]